MKRLIIIALVFSLVFYSCDTGNNGNSNGNGNGEKTDNSKKLVINGIGVSGDVRIILADDVGFSANMPAGGIATGIVLGSNVTITLKTLSGSTFTTDWSGTGNYYVYLWNTLTPGAEQEPDYMGAVNKTQGQLFDFSNQITEVNWANDFLAFN